MAQTIHPDNSYGPGTYIDNSFVPVPEECQRLLRLFVARTPGFTQDEALLNGVEFEGDDLPCIPGPIKTQAVTAVLHAMVGIVGLEILHLRGQTTSTKTYINTNHAGLYPATPALVTVDGLMGPSVINLPTVPQWDKDRQSGSPLVFRATAIYPTADDGVWFQLHGSLDPWTVLRMIGINKEDVEATTRTTDDAYALIGARVVTYRARELEQLMLEHGLSGSIVHSPESWRNTEMGKSLARHPLVNYTQKSPSIPPAPLPQKSDDKRPLAGIKVVELARIIAATATGAALASLGAEVIRVNARKLKDYTPAQPSSLMAGKTTIELDLDIPRDHARLTQLFEQADVVIQGYRLGSLSRRGFGPEAALRIAETRGRGVVYVDENCYGPDGYYAERPGWQQVADAAAGSSYVMAQAFGLPPGQGVLPALPISDMSTGILTALTAVCALRDRAKFGGSYHGHAALTAYNMATLDPEVRLYQREVVRRIRERYRFPTWSSDAHVAPLYYEIVKAWNENSRVVEDEKYYVHFTDSVFGADLRVLAPVVRYEDGEASPRWTSPPVQFCHHEFRLFSS